MSSLLFAGSRMLRAFPRGPGVSVARECRPVWNLWYHTSSCKATLPGQCYNFLKVFLLVWLTSCFTTFWQYFYLSGVTSCITSFWHYFLPVLSHFLFNNFQTVFLPVWRHSYFTDSIFYLSDVTSCFTTFWQCFTCLTSLPVLQLSDSIFTCPTSLLSVCLPFNFWPAILPLYNFICLRKLLSVIVAQPLCMSLWL